MNNSEYYPPFSTFSEEKKNQYTKDLKTLENYFKNELNVPLYLMYGTLLGVVRDGDYLPHDVDVDLGYLSSCSDLDDVYTERIAIRNKLNTYGLLKWFGTVGLKIKIRESNDFDVWTSWIDEVGVYHINPFSKLCPKDCILPLKSIIFRNQSFLIPQKPEILLDKIYINWKIPLKNNYLKENKRFKFNT